MRAKNMIKATAAAVVAMTGIVSASADTIGVSVGSLSGTTHVGSATQNIADLGGAGSIEYFIPLNGANGTYGAAGTCGTTGFGTCADSGFGGGTLTMFLRFDPVSTSNPSVLTVNFLDLDLNGANDPAGFLENLQIFNATTMTPLTVLITNFGGLVTGDANVQTLSLGLGTLTASPLVLKLKFQADFTNPNDHGTNTPEH